MTKGVFKAGNFVLQNLEAFIWIAALLFFVVSPTDSAGHFTICPLKLAGFKYCPGCGLGRAMILLLHGKITESFSMHPLAIFALVVLVGRIIIVFRNHFSFRKRINSTI